MTPSTRPLALFDSVSRLRSLLIAGNLLIGAAFITTAVLRASRSEGMASVDVDHLLQLEPRSFRRWTKGSQTAPSRNLHGIAVSLNPPPPPSILAPEPVPQPEEEVDRNDQGVEIGGVLAENWEYRGLLSVVRDPDSRVAILFHKTQSSASVRTRVAARGTRSSIRRPTSRSRVSRIRSSRRSRRLSMSLERYERRPLNPPDGPTIWVVKITPNQLIYEVEEEGWKRYALPRAPRESVYCTWREWREWRTAGGDPEERPGYFILGSPPDARSLFEARRERHEP